jgi:hypothetical protein
MLNIQTNNVLETLPQVHIMDDKEIENFIKSIDEDEFKDVFDYDD